jgi:hypothetical protein
MRSIALAIFGFAVSVQAAVSTDSFSLQSSTALPGEEVVFRIDSTTGCYLIDTHTITRNGTQIEMRIATTDVPTCLPHQLTPILLPLGSFAPGVYEITVVECVNAPNPCSVKATLPLTVSGISENVATVPTLSLVAMGLLAIGTLLATRVRSIAGS